MEYRLIHSANVANVIYVVEPDVMYIRSVAGKDDAGENTIIGVLKILDHERVEVRRNGKRVGEASSVPSAIVALQRIIEREG